MKGGNILTKSVSENFLLQFVYQVLLLVLPLIISPYLTRTLGSHSLGQYAYVSSIAYYFLVLANLGISKHGQRTISVVRDDIVLLRKKFWSLFAIHFAVSMLSIGIYLIYVFVFAEYENRMLYVIHILYILSALFDITWLFYGLENVRGVVIRNAIIKVLETICILVFIKTPSDINLYAFFVVSSLLVGQMCLFPEVFKKIKPIRFGWSDVQEHIKPLLVFSISVFAVTMYTVFDKTLIGFLLDYNDVAYYTFADRIISIPRSFIVIIGSVLLPKSCKLVAENKNNEQIKYFKYSILIVSFIGFASLFGILGVGKNFATFYFGEEFTEAGKIMCAMSVLPLIIGIGDAVRSQYLIPNGRDKAYTICIILNAVVNIVLSVLLIPIIGVYGAVIGTCAAELFGCVYQIIISKDILYFKPFLVSMFPFLMIGIVMYIGIELIKIYFNNSVLTLILQILVGAFIYISLSLVYILCINKELSADIRQKVFLKMKQ